MGVKPDGCSDATHVSTVGGAIIYIHFEGYGFHLAAAS
jgi:hypothetical protein